MREQLKRHVVMAAPGPGFTSRVMTRIQERERKVAQRRATVGAVLLLLAGLVPFVLVGLVLASVLTTFVADPGLLVSGIVALTPALDIASTVLDALWLGASTVANLGSGQMLAYALFVLTLTLVWVRAASGSFQLVPHTFDMGGSE